MTTILITILLYIDCNYIVLIELYWWFFESFKNIIILYDLLLYLGQWCISLIVHYKCATGSITILWHYLSTSKVSMQKIVYHKNQMLFTL